MVKNIKKHYFIFLVMLVMFFIFNNSQNNNFKENTNLKFDDKSTVIIPNYKKVFFRHYESKYNHIYIKNNIETQSK